MAGLGGVGAFFAEDGGLFAFDDVAVDGDGVDVVASGDFKHDVEHDFLENGAQGSCSGAPADGFLGEGEQAVFGDFEFDVVHGEQFGVLLDEGVFRLGEDFDEFIRSQLA